MTKDSKYGKIVTQAIVPSPGVCPLCGVGTSAPGNCVKGYCRKCYIKEYGKVWRKQDVVKRRQAVSDKRWYDAGGRVSALEGRRRRERQNKADIIAAYGGKCECCGEDRSDFMTIDHINGGGRVDRETIGAGAVFYRYLRRLGYPRDEYRLLCLNCNFAIGKFGRCPHAEERSTAAYLKTCTLEFERGYYHLMQEDIKAEWEAGVH